MVLDRYSRIVRWSYLHDNDVPLRTSLCAIFWRAVLWTPLLLIARIVFAVACFAAVVAALFAAFDFVIRHWQDVAKITVIFLAALASVGIVWAVVVGVPRLVKLLMRPQAVTNIKDVVTQSVLYQGAKAVKSKVCPLVEIVGRDV